MVNIENYLYSGDCPESFLRESVKAGFAHRGSGELDGYIGVLDGWTPKVQSNSLTASFTRKVTMG